MKKILKNKKLIIILLILVGILLLYFLYTYNRIDLNNNQNKVQEYLENYMTEKYGNKYTFTFKDKKLKSDCLINLDGCIAKAKINNIYTYYYEGIDQDGNDFNISYSNSYIARFIYHKKEIVEDYYTYKMNKKIDESLSKRGLTYKSYYDKDSMYAHIIIYKDNFEYTEIKEISNLVEEYYSINSIIFLDNMNDYNYMINANYEYKHKYGWDNIITINGKRNKNNSKVLNDKITYPLVILRHYEASYWYY